MNKQEAIEYIKTLDAVTLLALVKRLKTDPALIVAAFEQAAPMTIFHHFNKLLAANLTDIQGSTADLFHIFVEDYIFTFYIEEDFFTTPLDYPDSTGKFYSDRLLFPIGGFTHLFIQENRNIPAVSLWKHGKKNTLAEQSIVEY